MVFRSSTHVSDLEVMVPDEAVVLVFLLTVLISMVENPNPKSVVNSGEFLVWLSPVGTPEDMTKGCSRV